jgi:hypothetical protein
VEISQYNVELTHGIEESKNEITAVRTFYNTVDLNIIPDYSIKMA